MTIQLDLMSAARAVSGRLIGENTAFFGVSTDTRSVRAGELFVALRGGKFDAHEFVATAREQGAVAAIVAEDALDCVAKGTGIVAEDLETMKRVTMTIKKSN